jgi:hypothetical protein
MRYAVDTANDLPWRAKTPNGRLESKHLLSLKSTVGIFEDKPTHSALEMLSRRIQLIERKRHCEIPEQQVDVLAKLVRKGIREAERVKRTRKKDRAVAVEFVLKMEGYWPP